jgi:hypothetical protein
MTGVWQIGLELLLARGGRRHGSRDAGHKPLALLQAEKIEADGVILGFAVNHALGVRFVATDAVVNEMDQSIWPTLAHASRSAYQLFKSRQRASLPWSR